MENEVKMQPRKIRLQNMGWLSMFLLYYIGAGMFIMNRLRGDDLDILEKEAKERIEFNKRIGVQSKDNVKKRQN